MWSMRALGERIARGSLYEGKPSSRSLLVAKYEVLAFGEKTTLMPEGMPK